MSILLSLMAALSWGGGDFAGGLASRKVGPLQAVLYSELIGQVFLLVAIPIVQEPLPGINVLLISLIAGAIGSLAMVMLYRAMSSGQMSIAAPVSALLAAALPILIGAFTEGFPKWVQFLGFGFALAAIWLISQEDGDARPHLERLADLRLPLLAGFGFGMYFVIIHQATIHATFWPLISARSGGVIALALVFLIRRESLRIDLRALPFLVTNATLDVGGNFFYILAGQNGRMDVAAVISALYPGGTVFLAWLFLKERLSRVQAAGIFSALVAIALMTL
jgi:drug/metabolite transporter (DMT)-like permease